MADLCRKLLEEELDVIGAVNNGRSMVRTAIVLKPDVIVLDIAMPILNGLDAAKQVKEAVPSVKLIVLTMSTGIQLPLKCFDAAPPAICSKLARR